jgi:hypothetical protein
MYIDIDMKFPMVAMVVVVETVMSWNAGNLSPPLSLQKVIIVINNMNTYIIAPCSTVIIIT